MMSYKKYFFTAVMLLTQSLTKAQEKVKYQAHFFADAGLGYARAEDGITTVKTNALEQMAISFRLGAGYSFSQYFSSSVNYLYTSRLSAKGVTIADNKTGELAPVNSALSLTVTGALPIGKSSVEFSAGPALLSQNLRRQVQDMPVKTIVTNNIGFHIAAGYRYRISEKWSIKAGFDFMNPFGNKDNWEGDLGMLNVCLRYSFR